MESHKNHIMRIIYLRFHPYMSFQDRQGREMLYGPTNEELITDIFRTSIKSYKSLPQLLYHIQWKFRDEIKW